MSKPRRPSQRMSSKERGFTLGPGVWTRLSYRAFDGEGELIDGAEGELGLVFGYGALLPAVEAKLQGLGSGSHQSFELSPREAYGERDPKLTLEVAREDFPPDVAEGDRYELERDDGTDVVARVLGVEGDLVVLDMNHPLAGQRVRFEIDVLEARAATAEELQIAESALMAAETPAQEGLERLIPAVDLLRRGVRS